MHPKQGELSFWASRGATIRAVVPKLTSIFLLFALNSSAWAATPAAPPSAPVSSPTGASAPPPATAGSLTAVEPASQLSKGLDLSTSTPRAAPAPFRKTWPFWTAVGVAVGAAVVVSASILARSNNEMSLGKPTFGTKEY
jgi:hypothetical protein